MSVHLRVDGCTECSEKDMLGTEAKEAMLNGSPPQANLLVEVH